MRKFSSTTLYHAMAVRMVMAVYSALPVSKGWLVTPLSPILCERRQMGYKLLEEGGRHSYLFRKAKDEPSTSKRFSRSTRAENSLEARASEGNQDQPWHLRRYRVLSA